MVRLLACSYRHRFRACLDLHLDLAVAFCLGEVTLEHAQAGRAAETAHEAGEK